MKRLTCYLFFSAHNRQQCSFQKHRTHTELTFEDAVLVEFPEFEMTERGHACADTRARHCENLQKRKGTLMRNENTILKEEQ
jgi:hypothetical protein